MTRLMIFPLMAVFLCPVPSAQASDRESAMEYYHRLMDRAEARAQGDYTSVYEESAIERSYGHDDDMRLDAPRKRYADEHMRNSWSDEGNMGSIGPRGNVLQDYATPSRTERRVRGE